MYVFVCIDIMGCWDVEDVLDCRGWVVGFVWCKR